MRAWEETDHESCTLYWEGGKKSLTIPLGNKDNVTTLQLTPGYTKFHSFCDGAPTNDAADPMIMHPATTISNDEGDEEDDQVDNWDADGNTDMLQVVRKEAGPDIGTTHPSEPVEPMATNFDLDGAKGEQIPEINIVEEDVQSTNLAAEILHIHHHMGHAPFSKIQEMARQGALLARLKNCPIPMCTACAYGKASRKAWRGKLSKKGAGSRMNLRAGDIVSVDQMVSPIPGLVAQITGTLTTKRYNYATVYVDQATRLGYVHLQKGATAEETLEGKKAFEAYARDHSISIKAYHADNGIFCAHKWVDCCRMAEQGLTFAGVNSHHENGIAKRRIKELQDLARTMLIHANRQWKMSVNAHLWPYTVRMASEQINYMPRMQSKERKSPMQDFAKTETHTNVKHWHPFGSPVYVLESELQKQGIFGKWKTQANIGIYLGQSPHHSRNVALVLNRQTGLVSPQFHINTITAITQ
jgi:hypothetical protein